MRNKYVKKHNLIFLFFDGDACMEQESNQREFVYTKELSGFGTACGIWLQRKFLTLYSLKTPTWAIWPCLFFHTMFVLHWSWLTPMHCLFSGSHFVDFIYGQMYQTTTSARFIIGQGNILHPTFSNAYPWDKFLVYKTRQSCTELGLMSLVDFALIQCCISPKTTHQKVLRLASYFFPNWYWLFLMKPRCLHSSLDILNLSL